MLQSSRSLETYSAAELAYDISNCKAQQLIMFIEHKHANTVLQQYMHNLQAHTTVVALNGGNLTAYDIIHKWTSTPSCITHIAQVCNALKLYMYIIHNNCKLHILYLVIQHVNIHKQHA